MLKAKTGDVSGVTAAVLAKGCVAEEQLDQILRRCRRPGWRTAPFKPLVPNGGAIGGFAAVLAADKKAVTGILDGNDPAAQEAVLAAASTAGDKLDLKRGVKPVTDDDGRLRPLQATSTKDEFWGADGEWICGEVPTTKLVRYDSVKSTRHTVKTIKGIEFDSAAMWVDEPGHTIYAAANGDLVRIPFEP